MAKPYFGLRKTPFSYTVRYYTPHGNFALGLGIAEEMDRQGLAEQLWEVRGRLKALAKEYDAQVRHPSDEDLIEVMYASRRRSPGHDPLRWFRENLEGLFPRLAEREEVLRRADELFPTLKPRLPVELETFLRAF